MHAMHEYKKITNSQNYGNLHTLKLTINIIKEDNVVNPNLQFKNTTTTFEVVDSEYNVATK